MTINKLRIIFLMIFILMSPSLLGHHFKGLPHFNYFENYPQIPPEEFIGQMGEYEFSLVIYDFQGLKKEDMNHPNDVRFYLVVFNLRENKVYNGPLTIQILKDGEPIYKEHFKHTEEESLYSFQQALNDSGDYSLQLNIDQDNNNNNSISGERDFILSSQKVEWGNWVLGSLFIIVTIVAVGSRRARILQDRKEAVIARHKTNARLEGENA